MMLQEIVNGEQTKFIDVRSPQEFNAGHFPGAQNIPLDTIRDHVEEIKNMKAPLVFYCRSGARSTSAVMLLKQLGVQDIYNAGGLDDLLYITKKQLN